MSTLTKRVAFHTLGCKLNFSETSSISRDFIHCGYEKVAFKDFADIYVINTCSVTENADKETKSIKKAVSETYRRREIQLEYNKKNKISATTIKKEITDSLESVYEKDYGQVGTGENIVA